MSPSRPLNEHSRHVRWLQSHQSLWTMEWKTYHDRFYSLITFFTAASQKGVATSRAELLQLVTLMESMRRFRKIPSPILSPDQLHRNSDRAFAFFKGCQI